ncbi:MAG: hypothetical protein ACRCX8_00680 [Sarcina sp.]
MINKQDIIKGMEKTIKDIFTAYNPKIKLFDNVITGGIDVHYGKKYSQDVVKSYSVEDLNDIFLMNGFRDLLNGLKSRPITRIGNKAVFYGMEFGACYRYLILDELEVNDSSDKRYYIALDKPQGIVSIVQIGYKNNVVTYEGEIIAIHAGLINPDDIYLDNQELVIEKINNFFKHFQFEISEMIIHYRESKLEFNGFPKEMLKILKMCIEKAEMNYKMDEDPRRLKGDIRTLIDMIFVSDEPEIFHDTYGTAIANDYNIFIEVVDSEESYNDNINEYQEDIFIINSNYTKKLVDEAKTGALSARTLFEFTDTMMDMIRQNKL